MTASAAAFHVAMGLCKCPKRKVTNLFCFEHRVNVCEHCLVSNHNKCIVQSYLQWLQDSDYNPNCTLSGYQCPACQGPVFPPSNLASPIADVLKEQLSSVNWARAGLGLPLIEEPIGVLEETTANDVTDYTNWSTFDAQEQSNIYPSHSYNTNTSLSPAPNSVSPPAQEDLGGPRKNVDPNMQEHSVVNFSTATTCDTVTLHTASSPRKIYDTRDIDHSSATRIDFDDDKYRRRPALSWFAQILKNRTGGKRTSLSWKQRVFMLLVVGVLGFFTLIIIMAKLGRASASSDPNLDPLLNPNIRVGKN
ncbi:hypothetical protein FQN60_001046 [Etheostoma spectabile]|uniref:Zinc finger protein-like 1 n=1 Tax=Etheostoma spectabile TaxID=54343 RepID=A0A5J5D2V3_9PERO|nr:hypothetical protein FQN60_001046 [Etheostoma spectabile]